MPEPAATTQQTTNKILYGFSNVYVAFIKEDGSYEKPVRIPGGVEVSLSPEGEQYTKYADDIAFVTINSNTGYKGDITITNLPKDINAKMLGFKVDSTGAEVEVSDAVPTSFALMFEVKGDHHARRNVFYKCTANRSDISAKTKEEKLDSADTKLEITVGAKEFNNVAVVRASLENTPEQKTAYDAFYTEVYVPKFA